MSLHTPVATHSERKSPIYSALQCVAVYYSVLQCVAIRTSLHTPATTHSERKSLYTECCSVLQCIAGNCSMLQWITVSCSMLHSKCLCIHLWKKKLSEKALHFHKSSPVYPTKKSRFEKNLELRYTLKNPYIYTKRVIVSRYVRPFECNYRALLLAVVRAPAQTHTHTHTHIHIHTHTYTHTCRHIQMLESDI